MDHVQKSASHVGEVRKWMKQEKKQVAITTITEIDSVVGQCNPDEAKVLPGGQKTAGEKSQNC
eukprot:Awhi_evm1s13871